MNYRLPGIAYFSLLVPVLLGILVVVLVITLRWFSYKERMAIIKQGLPLEDKRTKEEKRKLFSAIGLTVGLIGLAFSIGLATLGLGPWLLYGLIPLFAGLAMILASLIMRPSKPKKEKQTKGEQVEAVEMGETASTELETWEETEEE